MLIEVLKRCGGPNEMVWRARFGLRAVNATITLGGKAS